jgi:hypothetical protein
LQLLNLYKFEQQEEKMQETIVGIIDFLQTPAGIMAGLVGLMALFLGLMVGLQKIRSILGKLIGHPTWGDVVEYILPYVDQAIFNAFTASKEAFDEFGDRLYSLDKKKIANALYELIPDAVDIGGLFTWHPKDHISREMFEVFIEKRFAELYEAWMKNGNALYDLVRPAIGTQLPAPRRHGNHGGG